MIVREGINVQYSHDDEAMLAWLLSLREFAGVEPLQVWDWLKEAGKYWVCADYWVHQDDLDEYGGGAAFQSVQQPLWVPQSVREKLVKITLWKPQQTGRFLIEHHGYSCVVCGARCEWDSDYRPGRPAELVTRGRQRIYARPLVCEPCAHLAYKLVAGLSYKTVEDIDALVKRATPWNGRMAA